MPRSEPLSLRNWLSASVVSLVAAQLLVGVLEGMTYRPVAASAYSTEGVLRDTALGRILASFHYWGSAVLILVTLGLVLEMAWNKGYENRRMWFGALASAMVAFALQVSGNLLPMDRHGVQTAVVESGITGNIPVVGHAARAAMLGGKAFGPATLTQWWGAHIYVLPVLAVIAAVVLWPRKAGGILVFTSAPFVVALLSLAAQAPLGQAATAMDFGQYDARVSWYTWPLHAMMVAFGHLSVSFAWFGSVGIPSLIVLALVLIPWFSGKISQRMVRGSVLGVAVVFLAVGVAFGGPIAPLTGDRDPAVVTIVHTPTKKSTDAAVLALVARGAKEFDSVGCADCHGKGGAKGDSGPDLTNDYKLHQDPAWFNKLMRNPKSVNPSATMPAFPKLTEDQVVAISTFLSQPR